MIFLKLVTTHHNIIVLRESLEALYPVKIKVCIFNMDLSQHRTIGFIEITESEHQYLSNSTPELSELFLWDHYKKN